MDYKKIYLDLVKKRLQYPAKNEYEYTENHHIKPISICPKLKYDKNNIVNLSAREHFIAHALLVKYYKKLNDKEKYFKMLYAFSAMSKLWGSNKSNKLRYKCGVNKSLLYQFWKEKLSHYIKSTGCFAGKNSANFNKRAIVNEDLKQMKYIDKNQSLPKGWKYGTGSWIQHIGTQNKIWVYNKDTNQNTCIDKDKLDEFLKTHSNWKKGVAPTANMHIQQYNPAEGKVWISNIELQQSKYFPKDQQIPEGWVYGRVTNWKVYMEQYKDAMNLSNLYYFVNYENDVKNNKIPVIRKHHFDKKPREENKNIQNRFLGQFNSVEEKIEILKKYYEVYKSKGFKEVVKRFNYKYTNVALIRAFHKYLSEN